MIDLKKRKRATFVPLSSMSDIGFLLLIFIMLISLMNRRQEAKVDYPEARDAETASAATALEVWVDSTGAIVIAGAKVDGEALDGIIAAYLENNPDGTIRVAADRNTPYRSIDRVIGTLQRLQLRAVSFAVKESP